MCAFVFVGVGVCLLEIWSEEDKCLTEIALSFLMCGVGFQIDM